ncbi:LLM class F420-dependent oxidoreductase [Kineosporia mesophila]|uniref:LLM class F420-dependent oxidoreductase n=1 Tax=Kineosporia mesophila TaxID=566012 RepID=A0ABP7ALQ3_9ACTN|nr:LLM class F420-dependent oxidoreductase [Kineosporia mesophila]MCD5354022.1 LLM class F420-dependent oxidoreductase [Kineosporia mesophila]
MELGLHIADFTWTGGAPALGADLARHVREAEAGGIRRITVMDHFWQIRGVGPAETDMLEAYAALGFIVAHTEHALLHTLVTGVTYREPALLAKAVTTLNVLSGGRVGLGIGAAWNDEESHGLGFAFPPTAERFERLEEAIQVCLQMWSGSEEPFAGQHYRLDRTLNSPQSLTQPHPYLMIGGAGEKKTLRLVAQYADACNIFASPEAAHKLEVLRGHCDTVGRDYDAIEKTTILRIDPSSTADDVVSTCTSMRELGFTVAYVYASGITERERIVPLLADAQARLS